MKSIYNLETLVGVQIFKKVKVENLEWRPAKKKWLNSREEGYICTETGNFYTAEQIENGDCHNVAYVIDGNTVYHKPYVALFFVNSKLDFTKEFDKYDEAYNWGIEQANKGITVKLIL